MKRIQSVTLFFVFLLTSCAGQGRSTPIPPTSTVPKIIPIVPSRTFTPQLTQTPSLSRTPLFTTVGPSSTLTLDPAAFLSTFDPKIAVTRTRSSPQKCPTVNADLEPEASLNYSYMDGDFKKTFQYIFDYLNGGGQPERIRDYLNLPPNFWAQMDLTGDGVPELVIAIHGVDILMCKDGKYIAVMHALSEPDLADILAINDMNLDGVPEIVFRGGIISPGVLVYCIYEWNGTNFQSLIWSELELASWHTTPVGTAMSWYGGPGTYSPSDEQMIGGGLSTASIQDMDGNGTLELVLKYDIPEPKYLQWGPFRKYTETYQWNGSFFSLAQVVIDPPVYRFQAEEDGDRLSFIGEYQQALELYQKVISSYKLAPWSQDNYLARLHMYSGTPTATMVPTNQDEFYNLAAYARYRIMLLRLLDNKVGAAEITYNDLEKTFPAGKAGHLYAELATRFWENYKVSQNMADACSAAIQFADEYPDSIYKYLGNVEDGPLSFGDQGHFYTSGDLCPFH